MKKTDFASQLRRMQMHGWFDVLIKLLAIALAIGLGALGTDQLWDYSQELYR